MSQDDTQPHDADGDEKPEIHVSDAELEAALSDFEKEFTQEPVLPVGQTGSEQPESGSSVPASGESVLNFEDELQGLLGNKAKAGMLITRLASAPLLAAFCQISDISADCCAGEQGAVAILRNLDGDAPEAAAKDITTVVAGMSVVLAVNRADKLQATMYLQGDAGEEFAPPILFTVTPPFVEDVMLGMSTVQDLNMQGVVTVDSASIDRDKAMAIIAEHTRFGRGGSRIQ